MVGRKRNGAVRTMLNQFSRTQLLLGQEAMGLLAKSRVAVFGIGGAGLILAGEVVKDLAW